MKKQSWITMAAVLGSLSLGACGGSSGGGGDDSAGNGGGNGGTAQKRDEAAKQGAIANLLAKVASSAANQAANADDTNSTQSMSTKQQSGCIQETQSTEDVGSPFVDSPINVTTLTADDCRDSGQNGSGSFRIDGILAIGEAENGNVTYIRASDINEDPSSGGPFISQFESTFDGQTNSQRTELRGELNVCDNCASPTQGGNLELIGYLENSFSGNNQPTFSTSLGAGPEAPVTVIINEGSETTETRINGPIGFSDGVACDFATDYETVDPLITDNSSGQIEGGRLNVTVNDDTFTVIYNSDGSVTVNGETYTPQELAALNSDCTNSLENASQQSQQSQ